MLNTYSVYWKTPAGETKIPDPIIDPIMIPTPFINVIFRSKTILCSIGLHTDPFSLSLAKFFSSTGSLMTPVSLLCSLILSLDIFHSSCFICLQFIQILTKCRHSTNIHFMMKSSVEITNMFACGNNDIKKIKRPNVVIAKFKLKMRRKKTQNSLHPIEFNDK